MTTSDRAEDVLRECAGIVVLDRDAEVATVAGDEFEEQATRDRQRVMLAVRGHGEAPAVAG